MTIKQKAKRPYSLQKKSAFDVINVIIMLFMSAIFIYPLLMTLGLSFSDSKLLVGKNVVLFPVGFSLESYKLLLSDISIFRYYANTIIYAVLGTFLTIVLTATIAYPLTTDGFKGKRFISIMLIITMFFGGGMIPTYLVYKDTLHITNTIWAMILPNAVLAWNVIVFRNFFNGIPKDLREAAHIDGAGHFRVLFQIIVPLSKPVIATISLFTIVYHWNGYFEALLYLDTAKMFPIQMFLRKIMITSEMVSGSDMQNMELLNMLNNANPRTIKAAAAMIAIIPILCIYPFLQKYFTKGLLMGAVKS